MMKLMEELIGRAERADREMFEIADREQAADAQRSRLDALERELGKMSADGFLDQDELAKLRAEAERLGIELSLPTGATEVTGAIRDRLDIELDTAKAATRNKGLEWDAQRLMGEYTQSFDLASRVSKAEHEMYLVAIKNLVA
jgi:hypothetical protein